MPLPMQQPIPASELKLADVVILNQHAYSYATVKQITKRGTDLVNITLFRPYTQTADFSYTGGVICYIGIEEFTITVPDYEKFIVVERKELK